MKYLKKFENFEYKFRNLIQKDRYKPILEKINNAKVGDILSNDIIYQFVEYLTDICWKYDECFVDGNLGERLDKYQNYKLDYINLDDINLDEWELDDDIVEDYKIIYKNTTHYPPIVVETGEYSYLYSIIDGNHRANALKKAGETKILAFIGI